MKTLVRAQHDGSGVNGLGGCHTRWASKTGLCSGHDTAAWLNKLGEDEEPYGTTGRTNGDVRRNWLASNSHIVRDDGAIESPQIPKAVTVETRDKLDACLHALEIAYAHFGDFRGISNRFSIAGQQALSKMRDAIALATGRDAQDVQDDYGTRASKAEGGAPS